MLGTGKQNIFRVRCISQFKLMFLFSFKTLSIIFPFVPSLASTAVPQGQTDYFMCPLFQEFRHVQQAIIGYNIYNI